MFCRLSAVYGYSETSNIEYESTTYYYSESIVLCQEIYELRYTGHWFSSLSEAYVARMAEEIAGYGPIGQQVRLCQCSTLKFITV